MEPARKEKTCVILAPGYKCTLATVKVNLGCGQVFLATKKNAFSPFFFSLLFLLYFTLAQIFLSLNVINVIRDIAKKLGTSWLLPLVPKSIAPSSPPGRD